MQGRPIGVRRSVMAALAGLLTRDKQDARELEVKLESPRDARLLSKLVEWISPVEHYRNLRRSWARRGWTDFRPNGPGEIARRQRQMARGQLVFHHVGVGAEMAQHVNQRTCGRARAIA